MTNKEEIKRLKIRISELEDKDWYEDCIKQLEGQNDRLIKERDEAFRKVCERIRKEAEPYGSGPTGQLGYIVSFDLLDKIEKGVKNE